MSPPRCTPTTPPLAKARPRPTDLRLKGLAPALEAVARKIFYGAGQVVDFDDLVAAGWLAVALTLDDHDPAIAPFEQYACQRARWGMWDAVRVAMRRVNVERGAPSWTPLAAGYGARRLGRREAEDSPVSTMLALVERPGRIVATENLDQVALSSDDDPETTAVLDERAEMVREAVSRLPDRERSVVERHYFGGDRFKQIAQEMSVSPYAVSRAHKRAIDELERQLAPQLAKAA